MFKKKDDFSWGVIRPFPKGGVRNFKKNASPLGMTMWSWWYF
jgi:hypothetical protein